MKIKQIKEQTDQMKVDDNTKNAIINLIDLKTENDMKEILQKMDSYNQRMDASNKILGEKMNSIEKSFAKQNQMILWVIGIATLILSAVMLYTKTK